MSKVSTILHRTNGGYSHWCPGCEEFHFIATEESTRSGARWSFNGNMTQPTFAPSVKISTGHFCSGQEGKDCWCSYEARIGKKAPYSCRICHYFIRDGRIEFCGDSTHKLSGQTLELPALPSDSEA